MYEGCKSRVQSEGRVREWFQVRTGVRQGGVLSPLLFIVYMDHCLKRIVRGNVISTLAYADDVAVTTDSWEEL